MGRTLGRGARLCKDSAKARADARALGVDGTEPFKVCGVVIDLVVAAPAVTAAAAAAATAARSTGFPPFAAKAAIGGSEEGRLPHVNGADGPPGGNVAHGGWAPVVEGGMQDDGCGGGAIATSPYVGPAPAVPGPA